MTAESMYQEVILDYYRNPRNNGVLKNPDIKFKDVNPSCGDIVEIQIDVKDGKIKDVKFNGKGCAISQASASMLTEFVKGKDLMGIKDISKEDVLEMLGIELSPIRLKCALLSLKVLKYGVYEYLGEKYDTEGEYY